MSTAPYNSLWDGKVNGWRVWVGQYGETTPLVTATMTEPFTLRQVCLEDPTPERVEVWLSTLTVKPV